MMPPPPSFGRPAARIHGRSGGAIMVLMLLSLILLAAMVFYVFNVGQHVTYRIETQNAADNAAISGAGWVARSFNTVAMNNVEMARLIPLVAVLDAVPQGVAFTLEDQETLLLAVNQQIRSGTPSAPSFEDALRNVVRPNIENQVALLTPLDELFNSGGYDIGAMTFYQDAAGARGQIWQSIESLSALNVATMQNLGLLGQFNAFRGAQIAQRDGGLEGGGLLLPWVPEVPWTLGGFNDFETVVVEGRLPDDQDDVQFSRGPFDTLFGMRQRGRTSDRVTVNLGTDIRHRSQGSIPPPIETQLESATIETYFTDGTYRLMIDQLSALGLSLTGDGESRVRRGSSNFFPAPSPDVVIDDDAPLAPSQWSTRVRFASNQKLLNVFPSLGGGTQQLIDPEWVTDLDTAREINEDPAVEVTPRGMFISLQFVRRPDGFGGHGEPELLAWGLTINTGPQAVGRDPANGWNPVSERVWQLNMPRAQPDPDANENWYWNYDMWVGLNVGDVVEVRNPFNFDDAQRDNLPGPVNFTPGEFGQAQEFRRGNLTFLGIAHQPKDAAFMSEGFDRGRADTKMVGLAQAEVFNNRSWDLWTQMWHAQLVPVDSLDVWMDVLEDPQGTDQMPWLDPTDLTAVTEYLQAVEPLAPLLMEH